MSTELSPRERLAIREAFPTTPAPPALRERLRTAADAARPARRRPPRIEMAAGLLVAALWGSIFVCAGLCEPATDGVHRRNRRLIAVAQKIVKALVLQGGRDAEK